MVELTEREKKLALVKYIIHGVSPFSEASIGLRAQMLQAAAGVMGMQYDEAEFMEIGQACLDFQAVVNAHLSGFIKDNNDVLKYAHTQMHKGNDLMEKTVGKDFVSEALKLLGKGGK